MVNSLPGYDAWKLASPDDDYCEYCGVHERQCRDGWRPDQCTGECGHGWRDPDYELEVGREREDDQYRGEDIDGPL